MQKALLRWGDPANRPLIEKALRRLGRLAAGRAARARDAAGARVPDEARPRRRARPARRAVA